MVSIVVRCRSMILRRILEITLNLKHIGKALRAGPLITCWIMLMNRLIMLKLDECTLSVDKCYRACLKRQIKAD